MDLNDVEGVVLLCATPEEAFPPLDSIPNDSYEFASCVQCGIRVVINDTSWEQIAKAGFTKEQVFPLCNACGRIEHLKRIEQGKGVFMEPGSMEHFREIIPPEHWDQFLEFLTKYNVREASIDQARDILKEEEIRKRFGT